ncbi:MAG TPA: Hsp20/alpha crystallin family protein, partial [Saprospiraceae bacterium]|nr:Hsp20/alpha crystallin family protein [Saprospiraceae bacterium]
RWACSMAWCNCITIFTSTQSNRTMTLVKFQPAIQRGFIDFMHPQFNNAYTRPAINVVESADNYRIDVAAPGLEKTDFQVKVNDGTLTVAVQKETGKAENQEKYRRREFHFGAFSRSFRLDDSIDPNSITANYQNGILSVTLSKKPEAKPVVKSIDIQ